MRARVFACQTGEIAGLGETGYDRRMRVLISGSSGLVGRAVVEKLGQRGDEVIRLVRSPERKGVLWDPRAERFDSAKAEGFDAVVHLAGENIASGRWTAERKKAIYDSRVVGTRLLAEGLSKLERPPGVLIVASATGFYGSSGEGERNEASSRGVGFLADLCADWEAACAAAIRRAIRVVHLRIGLVLSRDGGALSKMLPIFKLGLGGRIGDGRQWMSWISIEDLVRIVELALTDEKFAGPVNAVSPRPVRNLEFTRTLASVLGRPVIFAVPGFALRALFGQMADELLLGGARVVPRMLIEHGFRFDHPALGPALRSLLA